MQTQQMAGASGGDIFYVTGYTVDKEGNIEIPLLGDVQVNNKTLTEVKDSVSEKLKRYITSDDFFVRVKLGGIRFST